MQYAVTGGLLLLLCVVASCGRCDSTSGATVESKSRRYTAVTSGSTCGLLLSEFESFVEIEHPYFIRGHRLWTTKKTVAGGKLTLDQVKLKWEDDHRLVVECRCQKEVLDFALGHWQDVDIVYTFSR